MGVHKHRLVANLEDEYRGSRGEKKQNKVDQTGEKHLWRKMHHHSLCERKRSSTSMLALLSCGEAKQGKPDTSDYYRLSARKKEGRGDKAPRP